jgi:hypothetical protein
MNRKAFFPALLGSLVLTFAALAMAQQAGKLGGTWDITIQGPNGAIHEQWIVTQDGNKVTGDVKNGNNDFPLEGTVDGNKIDVHVTAKGPNGERHLEVIATMDGDSIAGKITQNGMDRDWAAKRAKS